MIELAIITAALFGLAGGILIGRELGREEQAADDLAELTLLRNSVDALEHARHVQIVVEDVEPGSWQDQFNHADPGCELCDGIGRYAGKACPCVFEVRS